MQSRSILSGGYSRPNILWIFSDQQPGYSLSCNGDPNSRTPNLDAMSASGVNFRNAVSGTPLCCPFRGSLLTGRYPHDCVPGHEFRLPVEMPTAADFFNDAGYDTAYFGKWHLDGVREREHPRACLVEIPRERRGRFARWIGYDNNNMQYDCYVHGHMDGSTEMPLTRLPGYETDCLTDFLVDFIKEPERKDKPFFAVLSVQPPHNPYIAPPEYRGKYNPQDIKLRPNVAHSQAVEKIVRQDLAGMYAMIENIDFNVGRVVSALRETGLDRDTWVFYFSDHGDMHGSHGQFKKTCPWQEAVNIPFIVWNGGNYRSMNHCEGAVSDCCVNHVDILPTSLGLAGIDGRQDLPGFDYSGVLRRVGAGDAPDSAYLQNVAPTMHGDSIDRPYRGVVTRDGWKYVCTSGGDWLLYNLREDPWEECNLAFNTKYASRRGELRRLTQEWFEKTGDRDFSFSFD